MFSIFQKARENTVEVNQLDELIGKINLIDIREPYEFKIGTIRTAKNIPMGELIEKAEHYLDKEKKYYLMCQSGMRSTRAVSLLQKTGYQVVNVKGGIGSYRGKNKQ